MKFDNEVFDTLPGGPGLNVEICATLLTDRPPKLPLREELPSLGFEVIYNGGGVADRAALYESKRAVKHYRKKQHVKDMRKRRLFPKSASRLKELMEERSRQELELRMPHAFSYETYGHQLYDDVASTTSSDSSIDPTLDLKRRSRRRKSKRWKGFGLFRKTKSAEEAFLPGSSALARKAEKSVRDILGDAAFDDILAPVGLMKNGQPGRVGSEKETVLSTVLSGFTSTDAGSSLTSGRPDAFQDMEIEIKSPSSPDPIQSGLSALKKSDESGAFPDLLGNDPVLKRREEESMSSLDAMFQHTLEKGLRDWKIIPDEEESESVPAPASTTATEDAVAPVALVFDEETQETASSEEGEEALVDEDPSFQKSKHGWSAKAALKNATTGVFEAMGLKSRRGRFGKSDIHSISELADATRDQKLSWKNAEWAVLSLPELIEKLPDDRLALHVLCDYGLPDRTVSEANAIADVLVRDISSYQKLIELVVTSNPEACRLVDVRGDLPSHLLARTLMEWEAQWYEVIYKQAAREGSPNGKTTRAISVLYQTMSKTMECLLRPICRDKTLCRRGGSVGVVLPLHMACIFTSSVGTLRNTLESYPDAAHVRCDLGDLQTFVPTSSLPLELHEGLSTDFPKWEVEAKLDSIPDLNWSQSTLARDDQPENQARRSDLLFAYYPMIEPLRYEKARIRRLEARITFEAKLVADEERVQLTQAAERLWVWMCTFQEEKSLRPTYVKSVTRIVGLLPAKAAEYLAFVRGPDGRCVIDAAAPRCSRVIRGRLHDLGYPEQVLRNKVKERSDLAGGRKQISVLSRKMFNINEELLPTSFIVLPYKLAKGANGRVEMASNSSAQTAIKFGECLLQLTDPRSVLYFLDVKSIKHYDQSIYEAADDETVRLQTYSKIRHCEAALLDLYADDKAYLYLIDEATGMPVVPDSDEKYPIVVREPVRMVRKLLPLMLSGMILMRGDKAFSVLANVILDPSITVVAPNWVKVAEDLRRYAQLYVFSEQDSTSMAEEVQVQLGNFASTSSAKKRHAARPKNGSTEWNVELSILKMVMEMNDKERGYCGLKADKAGGEGVIWHLPETKADPEGALMADPVEALRSERSAKKAKVEELRKKYESAILGERKDDAPDVDELSRKHEALAKQHDHMYVDRRSRNQQSEGVHTDSDSTPPLGFPQPQTDSSDDDKPGRRQTLMHQLSKGGVSDRGILKSLNRKHFLFFEGLTYETSHVQDDVRDPSDTVREVGSQSERVWREVTNQLDTSDMQVDDTRVICLKAQLAQEARKLSFLHKKVVTIKRDERMTFQREHQLCDLEAQGELNSPAFDSNVADARKLLLRLCNLEDRLLFDEIEIQHLKLGAYSLDRQIDELQTASGGSKQPSGNRADIANDRVQNEKHGVFPDLLEDSEEGSVPMEEIQLLEIDEISATSGHSFFIKGSPTPSPRAAWAGGRVEL